MNINKPDGIIFDVDGTIWDSTGSVEGLWNKAIRENSHIDVRVSREQLKQLFGKTMEEIGDILFPMLPCEERRKLEHACHTSENEGLRQHPGIVYEDMKRVMARLSKKYSLYVVSNCQSGYIEMMSEVTGIDEYICDFTCFGDTGKGKAYNIDYIAKKHGLSHPVYIGDTEGDADACKEAGVPFIYAAYGFGQVPQEKACATIYKPAELLEIFD